MPTVHCVSVLCVVRSMHNQVRNAYCFVVVNHLMPTGRCVCV